MVKLEFDQEEVNRFAQKIANAQALLGRTPRDAVQWGAVKLCESLAASTRVSVKKRPVVPNPLFTAKSMRGEDQSKALQAQKDMRRARFGVMKYKRFGNGEQYFVPIYRAGQFGQIRFKNKKTAEWFTVDRVGGRVIKELYTEGMSGDIPGIMQSKKRDIGRSGLAKMTWNWAKAHSVAGGIGEIMGVPAVAVVSFWEDGTTTSLSVVNNLRYAEQAFQGGKQDVSTALARATAGMEFLINRDLQRMRKEISASL